LKYVTPPFYWSLLFVVKAIVFTFARVEVVGKENMPRRGAVIIASNHVNNADPPVLGATMPRRLAFMAKQEMFQWPVLGMAARLGGCFPVRRSEADLGALRKATEVLRRGEALAMFPEGARSRDGEMHKAHPGTALLALRTEAPVLPVAISGTENIVLIKLPLDLVRLRRPRIRVVVGAPFFLPPVERITTDEVERCTTIIMGRIAGLLPPSYRGEYAGAVPDTTDSEGGAVTR
jgi:1-acyl-sn-glycerol-3-phosphate acyltransferase